MNLHRARASLHPDREARSTTRLPSSITWAPGTLLDVLDTDLRDQLVELGRPCTYEDGDQLLGQGEESAHVFILLSGMVKVTAVNASGSFTFLAVRIAGDMVGEMAAAAAIPRTASVISCGKVLSRRLSAAEWNAFLVGDPRAYAAKDRVLTERFRRETERRVEFTDQPAPVRIARVLQTFEQSYAQSTAKGRELTFPFSQSELASAADCRVASVQSTLRAMRQQGVVRTGYLRMTICDPQALADWPR